jgi:hypothetical protein
MGKLAHWPLLLPLIAAGGTVLGTAVDCCKCGVNDVCGAEVLPAWMRM